jgi:hypothetical protein
MLLLLEMVVVEQMLDDMLDCFPGRRGGGGLGIATLCVADLSVVGVAFPHTWGNLGGLLNGERSISFLTMIQPRGLRATQLHVPLQLSPPTTYKSGVSFVCVFKHLLVCPSLLDQEVAVAVTQSLVVPTCDLSGDTNWGSTALDDTCYIPTVLDNLRCLFSFLPFPTLQFKKG